MQAAEAATWRKIARARDDPGDDDEHAKLPPAAK
jgi:hypothetical protein